MRFKSSKNPLKNQNLIHPLPNVATLLAVASVWGCGDGIITDDGTPPEPVFTVQAEATGALSVEGDLRGALAWTVYDPALIDCLAGIEVDGILDPNSDADWETAGALNRCYAFSERGHVETDSVAIEVSFPAQFGIDVHGLPNASYLSGENGARLGIADVLIYTDDNGNGVFNETPRGALSYLDRVVGSSSPLDEEDVDFIWTSVVYREGDVSSVWKLYTAIYGCPEPPLGFSTVTIQFVDDSPECVVDDRVVSVELYEDGQAEQLACAADPGARQVHEPRGDVGLPAGTAAVCADGDFGRTLYTTEEATSVCPTLRRYSLVGCDDVTDEDTCRQTFWDHEADPAGWWPCGSNNGERIGIYAASATFPATSANDSLVTFSWRNGIGQVAAEDLFVSATVDSAETVVRFEGGALVLNDNDNNGVFNAGDTLTVIEPEDHFNLQSTPGTYRLELFVESQAEPLSTGYFVPVELPTPPQIELSAADAPAPITLGGNDVATLTYVSATGAAYPLSGLRAGAYVGGEYPISFTGEEGISLLDDVNADGLFGPGDTIVLRDSDAQVNDLSPELVATFGSTLYLDLQAEYAFATLGYVGSASVEVE